MRLIPVERLSRFQAINLSFFLTKVRTLIGMTISNYLHRSQWIVFYRHFYTVVSRVVMFSINRCFSTVIRKSSKGCVYICARGVYINFFKLHWFIVFRFSIWGTWCFFGGGLSPPNSPWRWDWCHYFSIALSRSATTAFGGWLPTLMLYWGHWISSNSVSEK